MLHLYLSTIMTIHEDPRLHEELRQMLACPEAERSTLTPSDRLVDALVGRMDNVITVHRAADLFELIRDSVVQDAGVYDDLLRGRPLDRNNVGECVRARLEGDEFPPFRQVVEWVWPSGEGCVFLWNLSLLVHAFDLRLHMLGPYRNQIAMKRDLLERGFVVSQWQDSLDDERLAGLFDIWAADHAL